MKRTAVVIALLLAYIAVAFRPPEGGFDLPTANMKIQVKTKTIDLKTGLKASSSPIKKTRKKVVKNPS